ncbi:MAG TPA: glycosyltransferase family 4 protein [Mesotoga sp.]|nr:glycosyltransferase family 4 protein [Mesotoga sp.]MDD5745101.1 glycosyltransferase family 4 protein [Mesotoga sp.]HOI63057.1 glycosyltransferase family 4 protein [Mesotoga sp.]HPI17776.1 glycosyltransferase family 4 protein [Mesotoga sp.]HPX21361.1 glycosyltransferase family 4 protein [Mesotoga sp.]
MKYEVGRFTENLKEVASKVDKYEIDLEEAVKALRRFGFVEDDYSALEYLTGEMTNSSRLFELGRSRNAYIRVLAYIRLGGMLPPDGLSKFIKSLELERLAITALMRGMARNGRTLPVETLYFLFGMDLEIDELLLETVELKDRETNSAFLLESSMLRGNSLKFTGDMEEELMKGGKRGALALDYLDFHNVNWLEYLNRSNLSDPTISMKAILKAVRRGIVPEFLSKCRFNWADNLYRSLEKLRGVHTAGGSLIQFSFHGDPFKSGQGSSGGIGTFLRTLGNELADILDSVVTVVPLEETELDDNLQLYRVEKDGHLFLYFPFYGYQKLKAAHFIGSQWSLASTIDDILSIAGISPAYFHTRFSDYASLSMMKLARIKGIKTHFTLTVDPQRRFSGNGGTLLETGIEKIMEDTSRVQISWRMLRESDSLIGIGARQSERQLISYYPSLIKEDLRSKLNMVPEGISLRDECPAEIRHRYTGYNSLFEVERKYHIERDRKTLPVILTVGRLDPLKGQFKLLKAWGESPLFNRYNLVIVGGSVEDPDEVEAGELRKIEEYIRKYPRLSTGFCHLSAMGNDYIRCLEKDIAVSQGPRPPVYAAPSFKEEFGIAILEAMAAGFLAIAPRRGGVKEYIKHGLNGFLIDTTSVETIKRYLVKILLDRDLSPRKMKMLAENGSRTVYRRYSISVVAGMFADIYKSRR